MPFILPTHPPDVMQEPGAMVGICVGASVVGDWEGVRVGEDVMTTSPEAMHRPL